MDLMELMILKSMSSAPLEEVTITGNPAVFTTDVKKSLKTLSIPFTPTQTGSGDPSLDNVRPIYGRTSLNIYHSSEDTTNPVITSVSWQAQQGEVYGGTFNAVTGILSIEWIKHTARFGSIIFNVGDTMTQGNLDIPETIYVAGESGVANNNLCDVAKFYWAGLTNTTPHFYTAYSTGDKIYRAFIILPNDTDPDTVVSVCSKLKEPVSVQLDPVTIKTLIGENHLWTDTSGTNTITYLKKE